MARSSRQRAAAATAQPAAVAPQSAGVPLWAEAPLLLAAALAPLVGGALEPLPPLLLGCLVWLALLLRAALPGAPPVRPLPGITGWLAGLFGALAALTFLISVNRGATHLQALVWISCAVALWLAADLCARGGAGRLLAAILAGALVAAGLGVQEYLIHLRQGHAGWRVFGSPDSVNHWNLFGYVNPNFFAGCLVPVLLLTLGLALRRPESFKPGIWLLVLALLTACFAAALAATGSKGGVLSLIVGGAVLIAAILRRGELRSGESRVRLGLLALAMVAGLALCSGSLRHREKDFAEGNATSGAAVGPAELCADIHPAPADFGNPFLRLGIDNFRFLTWKATAGMGARRPVLGWGAGTFDTAFAANEIAGFTRHAHNSYLQLFAEEGIAAPLLWLALVGLAGLYLWNAPVEREWGWAPGVLAALAAGAFHNCVDSLLFVPGIAFLSWLLIALAVGSGEGRGERGESSQQSAVGSQPENPIRLPRTPNAERRTPNARRPAIMALAVVFLVVTGLAATGRMLLNGARAEMMRNPTGAVDTLLTAQMLLPMDHQIADAQRLAYLQLGRLDDGIAAGKRALRCAPYRPPGYLFVANVLKAQGGPGNTAEAEGYYKSGLEIAPDDVHLLYAYAQFREEMGDSGPAVDAYRKIAAVEDSPAGMVRPLGEVLDYRFAEARLALAREADAARRPEEAAHDRKRAACLLAERRDRFDADPLPYRIIGDWDPYGDHESRLRDVELRLWEGLAQEYRRQGENRLAELAEAQVQAVNRSWEGLPKLSEQFRTLHSP